jgi:hypothetical protein
MPGTGASSQNKKEGALPPRLTAHSTALTLMIVIVGGDGAGLNYQPQIENGACTILKYWHPFTTTYFPFLFFAKAIFVLRPHLARPLRRDLFPNSHEARSGAVLYRRFTAHR